MNRRAIRTITSGTFLLVAMLSAAWQARAQDAKSPYPSMAPVEQYLMDRDSEIALARSAAPKSIAKDAEVVSIVGVLPEVFGINNEVFPEGLLEAYVKFITPRRL